MKRGLLLAILFLNSLVVHAETYKHYNWRCLTDQGTIVSKNDVIKNQNYELKTFQSNGVKGLPADCIGKQQDKNYSININNNGGEGGTLIYNNDGSMYISLPSRIGHTFIEWKTSDANAPADKIPNWYEGNLSYIAQWEANLYWTDLNGYFNGGSYDHLEHATAKIYINGQYLGQLSDFCRQLPYGTKYKFEIIPELGYEVDKTVWEGTVEGDTRICPTISPKTYTITFDDNGGTGGPNTQYFKWNSGEKISTTIPTRDEYTFKGWEIHENTKVIGTLQAGDNIPTSWGSFRAVAIWKENIKPWSKVLEKNNYRVTYNTWTDVDYTIKNGVTVNKIYCDAQVWRHTAPNEERAYVYPEIYINGNVVARGSKKEGDSWQWTSSTTEANGTWYSGTHIMGRSSGGTVYASNDFYRYIKCTLTGTIKE